MGLWRKIVGERKERAVPYQHELKLDELDARVSHMEDQMRRLRGYVYAKKGLVGAPGEPLPGDERTERTGAPTRLVAAPAPPQAETRDEIRRRLVATGAFVPGRPPVHRE